MIQWLQRAGRGQAPPSQDRWAMLTVTLALLLRQSPAEAALTAIALRILLERARQSLSRRA
jgi:hypothetical protein